ncbi:MAG: efflux RND transporter permease subunit [Pseudomonadota bacterium]
MSTNKGGRAGVPLDLFYRQPRLTVLLLGLMLVAGISALSIIPRQEDPELTERFGDITVLFPGASAERVEALVTEKLENRLQDVAEIKTIKSRSHTGISRILIQLEDYVTQDQVDGVWSRLRSKMGEFEAELPEGAGFPELERGTTAAFTFMVGLTWQLDTPLQLDLLQRLAKELAQRIVLLPGTKEVEVYGEPEEEILVTIDSAALAQAGMTVQEISETISGADPKVPAGRLQSARSDMIVEVAGQLDTVNRIRSIPLLFSEGGEALRVGDLALVEKRPVNPPDSMAIIHGERAIVVAAKMESNRRVDLWVTEAQRIFEEFQEELPSGITAEIIFDQSVHTEERLGNLAENLVLGAAIVLGVLFLMMGWRAALPVASALPLTLLIVLALLNALGVPLHQVSLSGLIVALGLLIDNAIVAVDHYNHRRADGSRRGEAISETVSHLLVPLVASTLTTSLTFLPLVLAPGNAGEFVSTLGIAVILSIITSMMLSLTIIPALAAFLDRGRRVVASGFLHNGLSHQGLLRAYRKLLDRIIKRPWMGVLGASVIPVAGFLAAGQLVEQFFPPVSRDQFQIQLNLPAHASLAETRENIRHADEILRAHPEVKNSVWFIGETPPRVFYNVSIFGDGTRSFGAGFVDTRSPTATRELLPRLQREMMQAFPNASVLTLPFDQGPPLEAPIEVRVFGPDLETLQRLGEEVRLVLSRTRQVTYSRASVEGGRPKFDLVPDELEVKVAGLDLTAVARAMSAKLDGLHGGTVLEGTEELPVRVRLSTADRSDLQRIIGGSLRPNGPATAGDDSHLGVPLAAIAEARMVPQTNRITRHDGERVNVIQAFVEPFTLPAKALADFRERLEQSEFSLPPGYALRYGGETEGSGEAQANLASVLLPLLVIMIGTVVLAFNSFRYAAVIGVVAVLSVGGALLTLWVFGYPMGFMAVIGTMGLIGLAINDSIVLLSALRADTDARSADPAAIREIVVGATRHILSTTLTTIGGFLPLIIWGGAFWAPLAIAVAGGMIGATLLALFFVPSLFVVFVRIDRRRATRRRDLVHPAPAAGTPGS